MTASCIYEGWVRHRRHGTREHRLRARLFMLYLDLGELPGLFDGYRLASARGRALVEFRRADYLGDPRRPLAEEVLDLVQLRTGERPGGPVRLLTVPRCLGHSFNPVSFYYCFDAAGDRVAAIVAEVTNTPWGERHAYVLSPDGERPGSSIMRGRFAKEFHVSPFMGMDHTYEWRVTTPGERLIFHIDSERDEQIVFDATLSLRRGELTPAHLRAALARHPLLSLRIVAGIYVNGLRLWLRGVRHFPNPSGAPLLGSARRRHARDSREGAIR
ncbi:MAG: DUF1365 domain-containing protein [Solirubrobacteraceae bacterium]